MEGFQTYFGIRLAQQHPDVLNDPSPEAFLLSLGESALKLQLNARTDNFRKKFRIETTLREQIYKAFLSGGIEFPFPQRVVHLSNASHATPQDPEK